MKLRSYSRATNKSIIDIKRYVLNISSGVYMQDIHDIVNASIDEYQLKKYLNSRKDIQLWLFTRIKRIIDDSIEFDDIEENLIYMNILINKKYSPLLEYKYKLFYYILDNVSFSVETYCLIRHLIKFKTRNIPMYINNIDDYVKMSEEKYHYIATEILLLEEQYKQAYKHIPYVCFDNRLKSYQNSLYNYSPIKYERLLEQANLIHSFA